MAHPFSQPLSAGPARWRVWAVVLFSLVLIAPAAYGQEGDTSDMIAASRHSIAALNVPLNLALEALVEKTALNLVYASALVDGKTTSCQVDEALLDEVLACLLRDTGLDFLRLSSGTYVLVADARAAPAFGALSGQVIDATSGEPLADAHVLLADASGGAVTNRAGRFAFNRLLPGAYPVLVSYVGYERAVDTLWVDAGAATTVQIALDSEPIITAPIVVSELNWRLPSEDLGGGSRNAAALEEAASGGDVFRSLHTIVGVRVGDALSDVHVQGGQSGDHQYLLDGAPIFIPIPNGGVVGPFSPFALSRLTVRKAGYSVRHGSNLAGVIEADHALADGPAALTMQVDPLSLNARMTGQVSGRDGVRTRWMVAARQSLWSVLHPQSLSTHFTRWSAPDLFLLETLAPPPLVETEPLYPPLRFVADSLGRNTHGSNRLQDEFRFSDIHGAVRVAFSPEKSLYASLYRGDNGFGSVDSFTPGSALNPAQSTAPASFTSRYSWSNAMGQMRYESVIGKASFASVGGWASQFDLSQAFERDYRPSLDGGAGTYPDYGDYAGWLRHASSDVNAIQEGGLRAEINHSLSSSHFITVGLESRYSASEFALALPGFRDGSLATRGSARLQAGHRRSSLYAEDQLRIGSRTHLELGLRLTNLGNDPAVYAEPRLALRFDAARGPLGPWSFRGAIGLFRQFVNQFDVAAMDVNAVLPYMRFWLPVSSVVAPPRAHHATASLLAMPAPGWRIQLETYFKDQPHQLVIDYAGLADAEASTALLSRQNEVLTHAEGFAYGAAVSINKKTDRLSAQAAYEYSVAEQRIPNRFDGAWLTTPWNVPHRVTLGVDARAGSYWTTSMRWQAGIGRSWAFRDAYYNYLEPVEATRRFSDYDLSDPTAHRLPMHNRLDASVAYARHVRDARVQVRLTLGNLLAGSNVDEWSLAYNEASDAYRKVERPLAPFLPTFTVRLGF